ncbi:hypothetical protein Dsin_029200 [Dipteronia sinensis]|uniref:Uncharacterized protein n=1 Tax=Dipteronia sinensis TaxID=43782 RepID=A0AAE0DVB1_9ROSI|nr:hypothetical protein Dsin_029200 [Dipteronia sinensis]
MNMTNRDIHARLKRKSDTIYISMTIRISTDKMMIESYYKSKAYLDQFSKAVFTLVIDMKKTAHINELWQRNSFKRNCNHCINVFRYFMPLSFITYKASENTLYNI